jgi:hypothetical protein
MRDPLIGVNGSGSFEFVGKEGLAGRVGQVPVFVDGLVVVPGPPPPAEVEVGVEVGG